MTKQAFCKHQLAKTLMVSTLQNCKKQDSDFFSRYLVYGLLLQGLRQASYSSDASALEGL